VAPSGQAEQLVRLAFKVSSWAWRDPAGADDRTGGAGIGDRVGAAADAAVGRAAGAAGRVAAAGRKGVGPEGDVARWAEVGVVWGG